MATAEGPARAHDRNGRRRPFSSWMKRLASLKSSSEPGSNRWSNRRGSTKGKKGVQGNNNPYPLSGTISRPSNPSESYAESERIGEETQSRSDPSLVYSAYENHTPATGAKSNAPTISTNGDTAISDAAYSKAGTMATAGGRLSSHGGGEGSTFSSPAPSVRSLTTTLTTVQSAAPSTQLYPNPNSQTTPAHGGSTQSSGNQQQVQFTHQFPTSSSPATAVPPHLIPHSHSVTYSTATANNVLTDNASVLTLASSSKRRRRNSLDTNASIRGLAPSSVFGGSRESLPLSVLSGNVADSAQGALNRPSVGLASAERISVYSASGVIPVTNNAGERGSFYTKQSQAAGDGASIRSGAPSHGRNDSTAASITGISSPLAMASGRISRRSSGWGEITGDEDEENKATEMADDKPNKAEASHEEIKTD
ncbi:hypothetical protein N7468_003216 [Penicillium chermesinum]|uniref:Ca2+-modulated nonselective cation channel polycystin n=1 Tax=Penicillium chermesinum TaxID=63820 RepID=A0A9W9TRL9_9EURO|nr:uncharacterized protein N7468_003216 [Penicillium chermesinum]KAJ5238597.1 hypothetical protein N7468_003216 [Penicillium chermesinum]